MANFAIKFDLKGIHKAGIGKHLNDSINAAITTVDTKLKQSRPAPKGRCWTDTFWQSGTIHLNTSSAVFVIECTTQVADMILFELLKDSSYRLLRGPYPDDSSHLCNVDLP